MAKAGGFELCEQAIRDKLAFEQFMMGYKDSITYQGKTYYAPGAKREAIDEKEIPLL